MQTLLKQINYMMRFFSCSKLATSFCLATSFLAVGNVSYAQRFKNPDTLNNSSHSRHHLNTFKPGSSQSIESVRYREVVAATQNFLASLNKKQRAAVVLPFNNYYRTRAFCYVLARCKNYYVGLRMSQLNARQKIALNNVLMKSYSSAGYSRAIQTMNREGLLEEMENAHRADPEKHPVIGSPDSPDWSPPPYRRSSDYYVAIFGEPTVAEVPSLANPWGIRFEGHHLSLNLTFDGTNTQANMVGTPMFFGSSPMIVPQSPSLKEGEYTRWQTEEGQQMLNREAWLARSFLQSLDEKTSARGAWSALPDADLKGGTDANLDAASYLKGEKPGVAVAELNPLQQRLLQDFAYEFWQMEGNQKVDEEALKQFVTKSRVWWFGDRYNEHGELYVRVQSDRYLIELLQSNTFGVVSSDVEANHVHTSFRDLKNDWDHNSLREHLNQYHDHDRVPLTIPKR